MTDIAAEPSKTSNSESNKNLLSQSTFHGRPIRRYSDGTVKAATSTGWVNFHSFDALCEYHWKHHFERESRRKSKNISWFKRIFPAKTSQSN